MTKNLSFKCFILAFYMLTGYYNSYSQKIENIRIDPANAFGGNASDFFKSVEYIPLETNKKSMFGEINSLIVTNDRFIILDRQTNSVLFFSKNGAFIHKIEGHGIEITNFFQNKLKKSIGIIFRNQKSLYSSVSDMKEIRKNRYKLFEIGRKFTHIKEYDYNGTFLNNIVSVQKVDFFENAAIDLGSGYSVLYNRSANEIYPDTTISELSFMKRETVYKSLHPYNMRRDAPRYGSFGGRVDAGGLHYTGNDSILLFTHPFDYTVYELTPNTFVPKFKLILPATNTLEQTIFSDSLDSEQKRVKFLQKWPDGISCISDAHFSDGILFLKFHYPFSVSKHLLYNLQTNLLIDVSRISPDSASYDLPFFNQNQKYVVECANGIEITTSLSSLEMFQAKDANTSRGSKYSSNLDRYYTKESVKSNPVMVIFKIKSKF